MTNYLERQETFLRRVVDHANMPAPIIRAATEYALFPGGKRIRPLLVYLAGTILDVPLDTLDIIAAAIELTHCYSLVHDDLPSMDNDDFRRGKLSCHKQFDEATAILVGDGMQAMAIELLLVELTTKLQATQIIKVAKELVKASGVAGMVSGQSLDLSELSKHNLTEDELKKIHHLKTGRLIYACFSMVLATQESLLPHHHHAFTTYAELIGLVFQIQDDYLDYYAPTALLGKNRASDLANDKTTFATLFTKEQLEQYIDAQYEQALGCLTPFGAKANELIELTKLLHQRSVCAK